MNSTRPFASLWFAAGLFALVANAASDPTNVWDTPDTSDTHAIEHNHAAIALLMQSPDSCLRQQVEEDAEITPVRPRIEPAPTTIDQGVRRIRLGAARLGGPKFGSLAGKTVYFSAGHGWYYGGGSTWMTQRGNTWGLIEDLISTEVTSQHIIDELQRMGAYVVPLRESDPSPHMVIVDDADPGFFMSQDWQTMALQAGWRTPTLPITDDLNPFYQGESKAGAARAFGKYTAWSFEMPADGDYNVYVSWVQDANGAPDAHYVIRHAGGESHYLVDQRRHGSTWVLLGRHFFRQGQPYEVRLVADSANEANTISADAVRIGGGQNRISRNGVVSNAPAYEEAARYSTQFLGAPADVWDARTTDQTSDVVSRPRFASWEHQAGEDAVYVAWHTNAPEGPEGTQSFAFGPESYAPIAQSTGVAGSITLATLIHNELVGDLRAEWDGNWGDLHKYTGNFGELNPAHNGEMPAALIEVAFHATQADANALREPAFRRIAARAFAQGIAKYFANKDGRQLVLPPEPPNAVRIETGTASINLAWNAPVQTPGGGDEATGYRVYLSQDGYAFNDGSLTVGKQVDITASTMTGPLYVRVTAVNDGGESLPSPVLAVYGGRAAAGELPPRVLVVYAYDRIDGSQANQVDYSDRGLGVIDRINESTINNGSYLARIGAALELIDQPFDSATASAVTSGAIALGNYDTVIWIAGDERNAMEANSRLVLGLYLLDGGRLIVSGSRLAARLAIEAPTMLHTLGVGYAEGGEAAALASGEAAFAGWADLIDVDLRDTSWGAHPSGAMDWLAATDKSEVIMTYEGGAAAVATPGSVVFFSFALENVVGDDMRGALLGQALAAVRVSDGVLPKVPHSCGCHAEQASPAAGMWAAATLLFVAVRRRRRLPGRRA